MSARENLKMIGKTIGVGVIFVIMLLISSSFIEMRYAAPFSIAATGLAVIGLVEMNKRRGIKKMARFGEGWAVGIAIIVMLLVITVSAMPVVSAIGLRLDMNNATQVAEHPGIAASVRESFNRVLSKMLESGTVYPAGP
jgi:hypothetical protein